MQYEEGRDLFPVIIPARAGSKGIPGKNIMDFCGKPLIAWSIEQALNSGRVSNVYVSTDGDDIAGVSEEYGARVIRRPKELATDTSSTEDALIHAMKEIELAEDFSSIVFLQATSPLRESDDIDNAIETFVNGSFDSLFSMSVMDDWCLWRDDGGGLDSFTYDYRNRGRRQERKPLYLENGSIYIYSKEMFYRERNRIGGKVGMYEMPFEHSFEIDSVRDVHLCELFMEEIIKKESGK